jgi:hypothetical protein
MRTLIAGAAVALAATPAQAEEWYYIGSTGDTAYYVETTSAFELGGVKAVQTMTARAEPFEDGGSVYNAIVSMEFDCAANTNRSVAFSFLTLEREVESRAEDYDTPMLAIAANSPAAYLKAFVCDDAAGQYVADPWDHSDELWGR